MLKGKYIRAHTTIIVCIVCRIYSPQNFYFTVWRRIGLIVVQLYVHLFVCIFVFYSLYLYPRASDYSKILSLYVYVCNKFFCFYFLSFFYFFYFVWILFITWIMYTAPVKRSVVYQLSFINVRNNDMCGVFVRSCERLF